MGRKRKFISNHSDVFVFKLSVIHPESNNKKKGKTKMELKCLFTISFDYSTPFQILDEMQLNNVDFSFNLYTDRSDSMQLIK